MKHSFILISFFIILFTTRIISAAEIPEIGEAFGAIVGVNDIADITDVKIASFDGVPEEPPKIEYSITPAHVWADAANIVGASIDITYVSKHQFNFRRLNIDPDENDEVDQYRIGYKYTFPVSNNSPALAALIRYTDLESSHQTVEALLLFEKVFPQKKGGKLVLSGNIKWGNQDFDIDIDDVDAFGGGVGIAKVFTTPFILSLGYNFKDDINNDDTTSMTGIYTTKIWGRNASFYLGVDDGDNISFSAKYRF